VITMNIIELFEKFGSYFIGLAGILFGWYQFYLKRKTEKKSKMKIAYTIVLSELGKLDYIYTKGYLNLDRIAVKEKQVRIREKLSLESAMIDQMYDLADKVKNGDNVNETTSSEYHGSLEKLEEMHRGLEQENEDVLKLIAEIDGKFLEMFNLVTPVLNSVLEGLSKNLMFKLDSTDRVISLVEKLKMKIIEFLDLKISETIVDDLNPKLSEIMSVRSDIVDQILKESQL